MAELQSNETSLWSGTPSGRVAGLKPLAVAAGFIALYIYFPDVYQRISGLAQGLFPQRNDFAWYAPYAIALIIWLFAASDYFAAVTTFYDCTTERLIIRKGILIRTEDEVELYRVNDVTQSVNVFQYLLGVGTIFVKSTDQTGNVLMRSVTNASHVRNIIRTSAEQCRQRRTRIWAE